MIEAPAFVKRTRRDTSHLPHALDRDASILNLVETGKGCNLEKAFSREEAAQTRRLMAAERATKAEGLAGHYRSVVGSGMKLIVSVVDPGHGVFVGVDVRRRNIGVRPDIVAKFVDETPSDAPKLGLAQAFRIANHTALGPAEGHFHQGTFPSHQRGQSSDFFDRDVGMIANTALARAQHSIMQDPVAAKRLNRAIFHLDGKANRQCALRQLEEFDQASLQAAEMLMRALKLLLCNLEWIKILRLFRRHGA